MSDRFRTTCSSLAAALLLASLAIACSKKDHDSAAAGTSVFRAKTAEGVALRGTIDCRPVMRSA